MMTPYLAPADPERDLVLERVVKAPPQLVWTAWTDPEHLKPWFCPKPWSVAECEIDLRPGGVFRTVMRSPDGELFPNVGSYLYVAPCERLVFTDALEPGFRPAAKPFFTGILELAPHAEGTLYRATAIHGDPETAKKHAEMGFHQGWGTVADQLEVYIAEHRAALLARFAAR